MFRIFEKYMQQLGERRGMLLLATILIWVSILLAVYVYVMGIGAVAVWTLSKNAYQAIAEIAADRAYGGDPWAIAMGALAWLLLLLLILPLTAARHMWRQYRVQEIKAQKALTQIEKRLFKRDNRTSNVHSARQRLARRALDEIETGLLGAPQPAELTIEERLIKLDE